jgi:hypothetical protein
MLGHIYSAVKGLTRVSSDLLFPPSGMQLCPPTPSSEKEWGWISLYSDGLQAGWPGFLIPGRGKIFLFSTASRLALGFTPI